MSHKYSTINVLVFTLNSKNKIASHEQTGYAQWSVSFWGPLHFYRNSWRIETFGQNLTILNISSVTGPGLDRMPISDFCDTPFALNSVWIKTHFIINACFFFIYSEKSKYWKRHLFLFRYRNLFSSQQEPECPHLNQSLCYLFPVQREAANNHQIFKLHIK